MALREENYFTIYASPQKKSSTYLNVYKADTEEITPYEISDENTSLDSAKGNYYSPSEVIKSQEDSKSAQSPQKLIPWTESKWQRVWLKFLQAAETRENSNVEFHKDYYLHGTWVFMDAMKVKLEQSVTVATKTIALELFSNEAQKTIPSVNVGGIAGGLKYIHDGLLFKLAVDKYGLYGGHEFASKAAKHELRSLNEICKIIIGERIKKKGKLAMTHATVKGIYIPLVVVVDYLGFTISASSILPLSSQTLKYGSSDGGKSVNNDDPALAEKMELLSKQLNLKPHKIAETDVTLPFPGDIEGHVGEDGRFYIVDTARLFPPEPPLKGVKGCTLYNLLRPELVRKCEHPLSPDAFTRWGLQDAEIHNKEVEQIHQFLLDKVIPEVSEQIFDISASHYRHTLGAVNNPSLSLLQSYAGFAREDDSGNRFHFWKIIDLLHNEGVNVRYLEHVRFRVALKHAENPKLTYSGGDRLIVVEMIARCLKQELRRRLREAVATLKTSNEEVFLKIVAEYYQLVFGETAESVSYWEKNIPEMVLHKFRAPELSVKPLERLVKQIDLKFAISKASPSIVFERLKDITGVQFTFKKEVHADKTADPKAKRPLTDPSLEVTMKPLVKFLSLLNPVQRIAHQYFRAPGFLQKEEQLKKSVTEGYDFLYEGWGKPNPLHDQDLEELRKYCWKGLLKGLV